MFGFGSNDKKKDEIKRTVEVKKQEEDINWVWVENTLGKTFGLTNIDRIYKMYMPELSEAILTAKDFAVANNKSLLNIGKNQLNIADFLKEKFTLLEQQNEDIKKQNEETQCKYQELQEKYNALVERMAEYIERENGKGR